MKKTYRAIGLMSGSSLDGLDIAWCRFFCETDPGFFKIIKWEMPAAATYPFSDFWKKKLPALSKSSAVELMEAHAAFGQYMGQMVNRFFIKKNITREKTDLIASHGHTVFHQPDKGFSTQIGAGAALAATTGCTVVNDFRSADIALGGQGAPLAPMADKMLFPGFDFYLNIGGIANISCNIHGRWAAFDICGANQILNALAGEAGRPFDEDGRLAENGNLDEKLFSQQYNIYFFKKSYPKSLSNQWVQKNQTTIFLKNKNKTENKLHTAVELIARLIADALRNITERENFKKEKYTLLTTGGGAFNKYLMKRIQYFTRPLSVETNIAEKSLISFKEAALMALLGVMRLENAPNCMASVTGATQDSVGGAIYWK